MKQITVENNQSIWDLAIQHYGSVDGIKQLILDNPSKLNLSDGVVPGTKIIIRDEMIANKVIVDYLNKNRIKLATTVSVPNTSGFGDFSNDYNNDYR